MGVLRAPEVSMEDRYTTVVVGGGCSGTLVATHLLAAGERVAVVEPAQRLGRGLAYRTQEPAHLLNSRAAAMSALHERPGHFVDWCDTRGLAANPDAFLPRPLYGDYLEDTLDATATRAPGRLHRIREHALRLRVDADGASVRLGRGRVLRGRRVVLAAGHAPPATPAAVRPRARCHPGYIPDPWGRYALDALPESAPVILLGTGLTAVDVALSLVRAGHQGTLIALSRHGMLPQPHPETPTPDPVPAQPLAAAPLGTLLRRLRLAAAATTDWRTVIDGLRPHTDRLWAGLSDAERDRFLRHLMRLWETHRHRLAPAAAAAVAGLCASGQLRILAGALTDLTPAGAALDATIAPRPSGLKHYRVCAVVNCTGPGSPLRLPVVHTLLADGLARREPLGVGLDTDAEGRLLDPAGQPHQSIHAIGPLRRGRLLETMAVPEIRQQAAALALA
jgi:uncharacterized NAD(P)/FAD-binding protein YdhS